jgi:fatty acid synthase subunit alpha
VKLWKEFDDTVFKLPKEKRGLWLAERKEEIIGKLNKDFAKPWFRWRKDGSVATDLSDMTYEETVLRMVRLMCVSQETRWVDQSLRNLTGDWLRRVEERFAGVNGGGVKLSLQNFSSLNDPLPFVKSFFETYPLVLVPLYLSRLPPPPPPYLLLPRQQPTQYSQHVHLTPPLLTLQLIIHRPLILQVLIGTKMFF